LPCSLYSAITNKLYVQFYCVNPAVRGHRLEAIGIAYTNDYYFLQKHNNHFNFENQMSGRSLSLISIIRVLCLQSALSYKKPLLHATNIYNAYQQRDVNFQNILSHSVVRWSNSAINRQNRFEYRKRWSFFRCNLATEPQWLQQPILRGEVEMYLYVASISHILLLD